MSSANEPESISGTAQLRLLAEVIPVSIAIARLADDRILFANQHALERFHSKDELIGHTSDEFYHDLEDRERLRDLLRQNGLVRDYELRVRHRDGSLGYVSLSLQPTVYEGQPAVLSVFLDITKIKEAEENLRKERLLLRRSLDLHEREHQLTAYEIHDGMVQDLTAALMFLESYRNGSDQSQESRFKNLAKSIELLQRSIDEARRLINGLRPPVLEDEGLIPAIRNLIDEIETMSGVSVEFHHEVHFDRLDTAIEMCVYRIVQEAINNVWHHSQSCEARVELKQQDEYLQLVIEDWGIGFELARVKQRSFGLRGIRERTKLLGGSVLIQSRPGQGTRIRIDLPFDTMRVLEDDSWDR